MRSGENMDRRSSTLLRMLRSVSKIGSPSASAGSARPTRVSDFAVHITLAEARKNPTKSVPQSPMNILAGLKLKKQGQSKPFTNMKIQY